MHDDAPEQPGAAVGGYRVERLIGMGGMAAVYEARRLGRSGPGERVACKVMHAARQAEPDDRELMRREAVLGLRFTAGHPGLVRVLDYFDDAQDPDVRPCIVMELVEGASVAELRGPDRRLPAPVVRGIAREVLEVLAHLHGQGVLHRDLSPRNILVTIDGAVKLADLGLAREMEQGAVHTMSWRGTPMYACPEAIRMVKCDARGDLFSLAAVLYELLAGEPPTGKVEAAYSILGRILMGNFPSLPEDTPSDLDDLVMGLLQLDPGARWPQTVTEALDLLRDRPMASSADLAALVAPARARRRAALDDAPPAGALPPGHVLVPRDHAAARARGRKRRSRLRSLARPVTRRAALVVGILAGLAACVAVLALVLRDRPGDEGGAVESAQPLEAPAPAAGTTQAPMVAPAAGLAPPRVAPVVATPEQPRPTVPAGGTTPRRDPERAAAPPRRRMESQREARRTGPAPALRRPQPLGDEPPAWGRP